ncbi:hypothetical protein OW763_04415 [Clostridium aestuarii]|uniref:Uncharacterized protein n=1 Tax=Clostridium aestuarii TaxID=338193 RepID=A0ABT4CX77_9CLOT|nr:hypothetical protein [Clostridium aestuarii]MCY6483596.1 hypothetical protein [Clostridium aestuarii]
MEKVCPVCNEIREIKHICKKCRENMVDKGRTQEYFDDYSADDPINDKGDYCVHVFKCTKCSSIENVNIKKIII